MSKEHEFGDLLDLGGTNNGFDKREAMSESTSSTNNLGSRLPSTADLLNNSTRTNSRPISRLISSLKSNKLPPTSTPESPVSDRQAAIVTKLLDATKRLREERDGLRRSLEFATAELSAARESTGNPLAESRVGSQAEAKIAELTESLAAARATISCLERQPQPSSPQSSTPSRTAIVPALRAQINELNARIERRTEQIGIHQHEIKRLEAHLGMTQDTVQELQEELDQAEVQKRALLEDAALAREERDAARQALAEGQFAEAEDTEEQRVALVGSIFDALGHARANKQEARAYHAKLNAQLEQSKALQAKVDQRGAELDLLMTQVDGVNARMAALRQELQTEQRKSAEERSRAEKAKQRAEEAEELAQSARSVSEEDKAWAAEYRDKFESAQADLAESRLRLSELEAKLADVESTKEELEACEAILVGLREELDTERTNRIRSVEEVQALSDQKGVELNSKSNELDALKDEFVATAADLDARTAELASKTAELDTLRMELETKTTELQFKDAQYGQLKDDHSALQSCLQALQSSFDSKQADYEMLNSNNQALQTEFESLQAGYDAKQVEFCNLRSGFDALRSEVEAKEAEVQRLDAALESGATGAEARLQSMRQELQEARDALAKSQQELETVRAELAKSTEVADVAGVEKSVMAGELRVAKEQTGEMRERIQVLEGLVKDAGAIKTELVGARAELKGVNAQRATVEQQLDVTRGQHEELQRQYAETQETLSAAQARLITMQNQLDDVEMRAPMSEMDELRAKVGAMTEQLAEMETLRAQVIEVEDLRVQVAELEDTRAQVVELERLLVEAQAGSQAGEEVVVLRARVEELEKARERAEDELRGQVRDIEHLETHAGALEEELRGMEALREEIHVLQKESMEQQNLITELQARPAVSGGSSDALERLQEQYDMVLQDARRMTAEVEGYDDKLLEVLKREKKLEIKVGNLTRKLRATQAKLDSTKGAQAAPSATAPVPQSQPKTSSPSLTASVSGPSAVPPLAPPSQPPSTTLAPQRSPKRNNFAGSSSATATGASALFTQSTSSAASSIFSSSSAANSKLGSSATASSRFSKSVPGGKPPRSPTRSPTRPTVPDFGPKIMGSINQTAPVPSSLNAGTGRAALRPLPIFSAQPASASLSNEPPSEPAKSSPGNESNLRKRPIPDEFSDIMPGIHAEVAVTTPRAHLRFKTSGAGMVKKGLTPSRGAAKGEGR